MEDPTRLSDDELKNHPVLAEQQRREKERSRAYHDEWVRKQQEYTDKCEDALKKRLLKLRPSLPVNDEDFLGEIVCAVQEYLEDIS